MTPEQFQQEVLDLGFSLNEKQTEQFERYYELLVEWNKKMNLTAITEKEEVYTKHFFDSLTLVKVSSFTGKGSLCDVGAGAGFPSLPLKILFPELQVTIIDSLKKRITFLETLVSDLGLENVTLWHGRAEDFGQDKNKRATYDFVTARAVARLNVLAELCMPLVKKEGFFYALKAAKSEEELGEARHAIGLLGGKFIEDKVFTLPESEDERHLLIIQKKKETPNKYPRKAGLPNKKPL